jgi:hypothetical protein
MLSGSASACKRFEQNLSNSSSAGSDIAAQYRHSQTRIKDMRKRARPPVR